jgi:hypothetical protein
MSGTRRLRGATFCSIVATCVSGMRYKYLSSPLLSNLHTYIAFLFKGKKSYARQLKNWTNTVCVCFKNVRDFTRRKKSYLFNIA